MAKFQLHPDGYVLIEGPGGLYVDTLANFASDAGGPAPDLPGLVYEPGKRNGRIIDGDQVAGIADPAPLDAAIAGVAALIDAKEARVGGTAPVADPHRAILDALAAIDRQSVRALRESCMELARVVRKLFPDEPLAIPAQLASWDDQARQERAKLQ